MRSPPTQRHARIIVAVSGALVAFLAFVQVAAAQPGSGFDGGGDPGVSLVVQAVAAGVLTLVIGGLFIVAAPEYTGRVTDRALDEPAKTFLYGAAIFIAVIGTAFVLAITIIGLIIAIPLLFIYALFALVAGEIGYLAAGRLASDDWPVVLLIAVGVAFVVGGVPILGGLIGFVLGCIGVGAVVVDYREDDDVGGATPADRQPTDPGAPSSRTPDGGRDLWSDETNDRNPDADLWGDEGGSGGRDESR